MFLANLECDTNRPFTYSSLNESIGLAIAALTACELTVSKASMSAPSPAMINSPQPREIRYV